MAGRLGPDAGIDLVAEEHDGDSWAIQAKAYDPGYVIKKADVDSFLAESSRPQYSYRLLIATTGYLSPAPDPRLGSGDQLRGVRAYTALEFFGQFGHELRVRDEVFHQLGVQDQCSPGHNLGQVRPHPNLAVLVSCGRIAEHREIQFKIGEAFPSDSVKAQFVAACAIALNDLELVNTWLLPRLEEETPSEGFENVYLGRLAGSHLIEATKFLKKASKLPEVKDLVSALPSDAQRDFDHLVAIGDGSSGTFPKQLKTSRNKFWHYERPKPHSLSQPLRKAMKEHADEGTDGRIRLGRPLEGFRAFFADDISIALSFPEDSAPDLGVIVEEISTQVGRFIALVHAIIEVYLVSIPPEKWERADQG